MGATAITVLTASGEVTLPPDRQYVIGRARDADITLSDSRVSRRHVLLVPEQTGWRIKDTSANGIWISGRKVGGATATGQPVTIRLGANDGPEVVLTPVGATGVSAPAVTPTTADEQTVLPDSTKAAQARAKASFDRTAATSMKGVQRVHALTQGTVTIGRGVDNRISISDLLASRHHAELRVRGDQVEVIDLASANGTFVNGHRVTHAPVAQRDVVAVGHHLFQLEGTSLIEYLDSGDVTFEVRDISVWAGQKRLMHDVTFRLPGKSLLAVVGPSGAGKSTLLKALTGFSPADRGVVRYAGRDLYAEYDELRRRIGYVPQTDPVHAQLTVRQALRYGAELRFPAETTPAERDARVEEVIAQLGLTEQANTQVSRLSGGQKKRTSTALELLTRPTLLFLDEPTSGLDLANDESVMQALRVLAKGDGPAGPDVPPPPPPGAGGGQPLREPDSGRTVIVVTHSVLFLDLCDYLLVLAPGGHVAYFGPPAGALEYFGKKDFKDFASVFRELENTPGESAAARFRASEHFVPSAVVAPTARTTAAQLGSVRQQSVGAQLATLTRRYLRVVFSDRSYLRLVIAFPILLGLIPLVIPAKHGLKAFNGPNTDATKVLVVLILCACFMGMANSVREIVKEREIYARERTIGLSTGAYLGSKIVVLTFITAVQCVVFTLIGLGSRAPAQGALIGSPLAECMIAIIAAALASMMIGLLVSTMVDSADKTMPILVLVTMAQLVLSGGLVSVAGRPVLAEVSWLSQARWGFAALASTTDLNDVAKIGASALSDEKPDSLWKHSGGIWLADILGAVVIGGVALLLTVYMLRRDDRANRRGPVPAGAEADASGANGSPGRANAPAGLPGSGYSGPGNSGPRGAGPRGAGPGGAGPGGAGPGSAGPGWYGSPPRR